MPIYSDNDNELEERRASLLAGAVATSSLAAAAAATIKKNPSGALTPRLRAAVTSIVEVVERAGSVELSGVAELSDMDDGLDDGWFVERLIVKLIQPNYRTFGMLLHEPFDEQLMALRSLVDSPTREAAVRAELFLALLIQAELLEAQSLTCESAEHELIAYFAVTA